MYILKTMRSKTGSLGALENEILETRKGRLEEAWVYREGRRQPGSWGSVAASWGDLAGGNQGWKGELLFTISSFCWIYAHAFISMYIYPYKNNGVYF